MTMAMTMASRGRPMKMADIIVSSPSPERVSRGCPRASGGPGRHQLAGPDPLDSLDDDVLAFVESAHDSGDAGVAGPSWTRRCCTLLSPSTT